MKTTFNTSVYSAKLSNGTVPTRKEVRQDIWKQVSQVSGIKQVETSKDDRDDQQVIFKNTKICFRVMDEPNEKIYLLAFQPAGKVAFWTKAANQQAAQDVLEFCDLLGAEIRTSRNMLLFKRLEFSNQDRVDISEWEVSLPYASPASKSSLRDFLSRALAAKYENIFSSIPRDLQFYVFTESYLKGTGAFRGLRENLSVYGKVFGPNSISTAKEFSENISPRTRENSIFVFLENAEKLEQHYESEKIFYDSNHVPTQFVSAETVENKLSRFQGVNANLILEMLTKMDKQPAILQAPEEIFVNDGFICLSDIPGVDQPLFGAVFTYSKQGLEKVREDVQIYQDIKFHTPNEYSLEMDNENIELLANKISKLVGKKLTIDVLLTRRWTEASLKRLVEMLGKNRIEVRRVYYVSSKTCRFVDEYLQESNNYKSFYHPYIMASNRIAFLKTCTEIRIFPNLFSLFIELLWPLNGQITLGDLEKMLWLSKKRIYRIQEFWILKDLEPIYIFRNLRKMYLSGIKAKLTIPLRLLI